MHNYDLCPCKTGDKITFRCLLFMITMQYGADYLFNNGVDKALCCYPAGQIVIVK